MTDRLKGLYVAFETDIRDDDAAEIIAAIKQLRGVGNVVSEVSSPDDWMARQHVRHEIMDEIRALYQKLGH